MARLKLKRATRHTVALSNGDKLEIRALAAMDFSTLAAKFDMETVELTSRLINHHQAGKPWEELMSDASIYMELIQCLPDLIANAINLVAGGDEEDLEAIREMTAEDFALVTSTLVAISLERIGGLGNLLSLLQRMMKEVNLALITELQKSGAITS